MLSVGTLHFICRALHATSLQGEVINHPEKEHIISKLKNLGFRYVSLDPEGYRTGSSNPEIKDI